MSVHNPIIHKILNFKTQIKNDNQKQNVACVMRSFSAKWVRMNGKIKGNEFVNIVKVLYNIQG